MNLQSTFAPVGVTGLQSAFNTQSVCDVIASGERESSSGAGLEDCPVPIKQEKISCPNHEDREAELYCTTCEQLICEKCTHTEEHLLHDYKDVGEACEGYMAETKEGVAVLKKLYEELSTQQAAIQAKIQENVKRIQLRMAKMLGELDKVSEKKLATIKTQIQEAETTEEQYQNPSDMSKGVSLINQMKQTARTLRPKNMKPDIGADMIFLPSADSHANLGQVLQCYVEGEGLKKMSLEQSSIIINSLPHH